MSALTTAVSDLPVIPSLSENVNGPRPVPKLGLLKQAHNISSLVSVFATGSRAVLRLPTQLLPVGKGFRK